MIESPLRLKKNEDRRLRAGHTWVYSNEVDTKATPLKNFTPGQEVTLLTHSGKILGKAYVNPNSLICARLFDRDSNVSLNLDFFVKRFKTALALRQRIYPQPFYRCIFSDSDFIPGLIVDRFDEHLVVQINTTGIETKKDDVINALRQVLPDTQSILFRNDSQSRTMEGLSTYVEAGFGIPPEKILLEENQCRFYAPLWTGQKTGWFFDHRLNRTRLVDYVKNRRVLDVFSYLGAWGVQSAVLGATEVVCVDSSNLSAEWIADNANLNQVGEKVRTITEDAFTTLKQLLQANETFDVIILDPPAFVKKQKDKKTGTIAYQRINEAAMKLLSPQGILISCSCSMHVSNEEFLQIIRRASLQQNKSFQILERGHQAPDHPVHIAIPETEYLKMVIARQVEY